MKRAYNIISNMLLAVVLMLAVLLFGVRLVGFSPYAVLTGSMVPKYPVGSLVYVREASVADIAVGDSITFHFGDDGMLATHQVIAIDSETGSYQTQGIANETPDGAPVAFSEVVGKVFFCIPYLGYVSGIISKPIWMFVILSGVVMWMIVVYMIDLADEEMKKKHERAQGGEAQQGA